MVVPVEYPTKSHFRCAKCSQGACDTWPFKDGRLVSSSLWDKEKVPPLAQGAVLLLAMRMLLSQSFAREGSVGGRLFHEDLLAVYDVDALL